MDLLGLQSDRLDFHVSDPGEKGQGGVACGRVKSAERVVQFSMEQLCVAMNYVAHCVAAMLMSTINTPRQQLFW
jgi:hypothetical protein